MNILLAKILFISANTVATYVTGRPPRPAPTADERAKYAEREETKDFLSVVAWLVAPNFVMTSAALGMCEIYFILFTVDPAIQIPLLHRILLPSPARTPTVGDFYFTPTFVLGCFFLYFGSFLRYLCYRTLGRQFTYQLSLKKGHKLITKGPYSIVRHPSYLGMIFAGSGIIVAQMFSRGTWWVESGMWRTWQGQVFGLYWIVFVGFIVFSMMGRVAKEDLMLRDEFKEEWVKWARKTPYAVIPYVW